MNWDGSERRKLNPGVSGITRMERPTWSPDGTLIPASTLQSIEEMLPDAVRRPYGGLVDVEGRNEVLTVRGRKGQIAPISHFFVRRCL